MRATLAGLALALMLGLFPAPPARGFAEDLCPVLDGNGGWGQCALEPCRPGTEFIVCETIAFLTTAVGQVLAADGVRSSVHFDSVYYLAQAAGLGARDAYFIAAHDEAADIGRYLHRDQQGVLLADPAACGGEAPAPECALNSLELGGINRNNFSGGGIFYHFMAPFEGVASVDSFVPPVEDPLAEPQLSHVRRWLYRPEAPLCVAGLTQPDAQGGYSLGEACYQSPSRRKTEVLGRIPVITELGFLTAVDWLTPLGEQTVLNDPITGSAVPASALEAYLPPEQLPLLRLGIYLHALQDRISHHRCNLDSRIEGPRPADAGPILTNPLAEPIYQFLLGLDLADLLSSLVPPMLVVNPEFFYEFSNRECDQLAHANRHLWETGAEQDQLPAEDQTTAPGLAALFEELLAFRQFYLLGNVAPPDMATREALLGRVLGALETPAGEPRFTALCALADEQGWLPLPGYCGLSFTDWDTRAGPYSLAITPPPVDPPSESPTAGGAFGAWLLLPLLWLALVRPLQACGLAPPAEGPWYPSTAPGEHGNDSERDHVFAVCAPAADAPLRVRALGNLPGIYHVVSREPDQLYVYAGAYGAIDAENGPNLSRIDPDSLRVRWRWRLPGLRAGDWNYPGALAVHRNGYLYLVHGSQILKLDPELGTVLARTRLPGPQAPTDTAHNGLILMPDGQLVVKSLHRQSGCKAEDFAAFLACDAQAVAPSRLTVLEPDRLRIVSSLDGPEHLRFRLSAARLDGVDYVYAPGDRALHRFRYDRGRLSLDHDWQPGPYLKPGQTAGTAVAVFGDWVVVQSNGLPACAPMSLLAIDQRDARRRHRITPFPDSTLSFIPSLPTVDADNQRIYSFDGYAGQLAALDFDPEQGFRMAWQQRQRSFGFSALVGPPEQRLLVGTDLAGLLPQLLMRPDHCPQRRALLARLPRRGGAEDLIGREAASGRERWRQPELASLSGSVPVPGRAGVFWIPDLAGQRLLRVQLGPD
ncbi:MAG: hypothetical protein EPN60_17360 [Nevskiaceae bacterium]|nr:MAG: hypothetical protein EPO48_11195 [Nevskiaceae bacterium]TAM22279.1 MAG: hypothetical protein EPN60_17360 [Nevskiaceae bacterium]